MPGRPGIDLAALKARLLARRDELQRLTASTGDDRNPVELDQQRFGRLSRMDAIQQQAMAQATEGRRAAELQRIVSALQRIDAEDYGDCVRCGEPIAVRRLEFDPAVLLCIDCAQD